MASISAQEKRYVLTRRELKIINGSSIFGIDAKLERQTTYLVSLRATKAGCNTTWSFDKSEAKVWPSRNLVDAFGVKHSYLKARIGVVMVSA